MLPMKYMSNRVMMISSVPPITVVSYDQGVGVVRYIHDSTSAVALNDVYLKFLRGSRSMHQCHKVSGTVVSFSQPRHTIRQHPLFGRTAAVVRVSMGSRGEFELAVFDDVTRYLVVNVLSP